MVLSPSSYGSPISLGWYPYQSNPLAGSPNLGVVTPVPGEIMCGAASGGVITSGGGYSSMFPAPAYQYPAVQQYITQNPQSGSLTSLYPAYNSSGVLMRAYPDVALSGSQYPIFNNGTQGTEYGTSASTPLFASMVTILNDYRIRNGMPPMGNILPFLWTLGRLRPDAFNDIVIGNSSTAGPQNSGNCSTAITCGGFTAAVGWDAVSGFGSVNFNRLLQYALNPTTLNPFSPAPPCPPGPRGDNGAPGC